MEHGLIFSTLLFVFVYFWDKILLCSLGWPPTSGPPVSASQVLELQACTTMPSCTTFKASSNQQIDFTTHWRVVIF
jgi:hypothetical protein